MPFERKLQILRRVLDRIRKDYKIVTLETYAGFLKGERLGARTP